MSPTVSVVVTTHETDSALLRASIESILAQTLSDLDVVVVLDGSADRSTRAVLDTALEDGRVRLVEPGRVGRGPALNVGLEAARADLVAIQDADDESHPERLERQYRSMQADTSRWILGTGARFTYDLAMHADWSIPGDDEVERVGASLLLRNRIVHTGVVLRRDPVLSIGGYSETRSSQFDLDLFLRVRDAGGSLAVLTTPLVLSRVHSDQEFEFGQPAVRRILDNYRLQSTHLRGEPLSRRVGYRILMLLRLPARLVSVRLRRRAARRAAHDDRSGHE